MLERHTGSTVLGRVNTRFWKFITGTQITYETLVPSHPKPIKLKQISLSSYEPEPVSHVVEGKARLTSGCYGMCAFHS